MTSAKKTAPAIAVATGRDQDTVETGPGNELYSKPVIDNRIVVILARIEQERRAKCNAALYSLGSPEWPRPDFFEGNEVRV